MNKKSIAASLLASLISMPAWGQATVGEVLDAGGKALSKELRESSSSNASCGFYYKLGSKYFAAVEGGERGTRVLERTISK